MGDESQIVPSTGKEPAWRFVVRMIVHIIIAAITAWATVHAMRGDLRSDARKEADERIQLLQELREFVRHSSEVAPVVTPNAPTITPTEMRPLLEDEAAKRATTQWEKVRSIRPSDQSQGLPAWAPAVARQELRDKLLQLQVQEQEQDQKALEHVVREQQRQIQEQQEQLQEQREKE